MSIAFSRRLASFCRKFGNVSWRSARPPHSAKEVSDPVFRALSLTLLPHPTERVGGRFVNPRELLVEEAAHEPFRTKRLLVSPTV